MRKNNYVHLIVLLSISCSLYADPRIVLFLKEEPLTDAEKISKKLAKPAKLAKYAAKGMLTSSLVEGIVATYGGFVTASDYNGELSFPRKHQKNSVDIVITPEVIPVPLFESTMVNWKRVPGVPAVMYRCQEMYNAQKEEYYWHVQEVPLSDDMTIPLAAIIIIAQPKNVRMDIGDNPTNETGNFVLPNVYVKKGIDTLKNSSYMLLIRHLFKPIQTEENREPLKILTQILD